MVACDYRSPDSCFFQLSVGCTISRVRYKSDQLVRMLMRLVDHLNIILDEVLAEILVVALVVGYNACVVTSLYKLQNVSDM